MAKPKDPGFAEWLAEIKGDVGKVEDPEVKAAWEKVLGAESDELRKVFRGGMREADYYRRLNELNEEKQGFQTKKQEWDAYEGEFRTKYDQMKAERDAARAEVKKKEAALRAEGLDEEADELRREARKAEENLDLAAMKKELEELKQARASQEQALQQVSAGAPAFTAAFTKRARQYAQDGFKFDEEEVLGRIIREQLPLDVAFEDAVRDQRKERTEKDMQERLKAAEEKGRREALTAGTAPDSIRPSLGGLFASQGKSEDKLASARAEAARLALDFQQGR